MFFSEGRLLKDGAFTVEDGRILSIDSQSGPDAVDLGDCAVIPGFVNTHTHSMQSLMRGIGDDTDLLIWLREKVYRCCDRMSEEDVYLASLLTFTEMLENGITSVVDFFYVHNGANGGAEAVIRAAQDVGIRLVLARTMMDWDQAPDCIRESVDVAEKNFLQLYQSHQPTDRLRICLAPHSAYGASTKMIEMTHALSQSLRIPCHMHVSDSLSAMELTRKITGKDYVAYLDDLGVLDDRFVAVHCIHCDEEAQRRIVAAGAKVSHNPVSNMFLGEPAAPIVSLLKKGVTVGLGTDGAASNNRLSILHEMKTAALHQKSANRDPQALTAGEAFHMATAAGAVLADLPVGDLKPGLAADFVTISLDDTALIPEHQMLSHLVYAFTERAIESVYIAGECVVRNGRACRVDHAQLRRQANAVTAAWQD